jgi:glycosyltransferase involved in cell wall biosynthesis
MLVSVVIPCYNVEKYIGKCLASVYDQSYTNIEVICIDNNSSDDTFNTLINFKKIYPTLIVDVELKVGANAARNKGLSFASGEWIQFLDADDLLLPSKIEHQVSLINKDDIAFIAGNCCTLKEIEGQRVPFYKFTDNVWLNLIGGNMGYTCSNLFNFATLKKVGLWNTAQKSSQEMELMFRIMKFNNNVIFDTAALTLKIITPGSITSTNKEANINRYILLRIEIFEFLNSIKVINNQIKLAYNTSLFNSLIDLSSYNLNQAVHLFDKLFSIKSINMYSFLPKHKAAIYSILGFKKVRQINFFIRDYFS